MDKTADRLLQLLRHALWQEPCDFASLNDEDYRALLQLARGQTVSGLVCRAMADAGIVTSDDCVLDTVETIRQHELAADKLNKAVARLDGVLGAHGMGHAVFKGQTLAALYPQPEMRTCGDVDFYVVPQHFAQAVTLIEHELGAEVQEDYTDKHFDFAHHGVRFEMHYRIETFGSGRHQRLFNRWHDEALTNAAPVYRHVGGCRVRVLPPEIEVVVVFKHLFNHLLIEGVGLRQFVDLAVLIHRLNLGPDQVSQVATHLRRLGYLRAFQAVLQLLHTYLGLPIGEEWEAVGRTDAKYADRIFATVMAQGNFGRYGRKHQKEGVAKSRETLSMAMRHCADFFWLAPSDIVWLIPRRVAISFGKRRGGAKHRRQ